MALVQQGCFGCFSSGVGQAFDPRGNVSRLNPGSMHHAGGRQEQFFSLTKDKAGNITIAAKIRYTAPVQVSLMDDQGKWSMKKTDSKEGYVEYKGEIQLSTAEMDKLSSADWSNFDYQPIDDTEKNDAILNHSEAAADLIPDEFRFTGDTKVVCHIHAKEVNNLM